MYLPTFVLSNWICGGLAGFCKKIHPPHQSRWGKLVAVDLLSGNARVSNLQDVPFLRWFCQKAGGNLEHVLKSTQNKVGPQKHCYKRGEGFNSYKVRVFPSPLSESFSLFHAIYMLSLVLEVVEGDWLCAGIWSTPIIFHIIMDGHQPNNSGL